MKNLACITVAMALAAVLAGPAFAQSSGNFAADIDRTACVLDNATGALSGGIPAVDWTVDIKVPNGNGTSLVIRPSFVTGLFTDTKVTTTTTTATAAAGVEVCVKIDQGTLDGILGPNAQHCVWYDKRFQQLSASFFNQIAGCVANPASCSIELILSTLSAHSFDFVAYDIPGGLRTVEVTATFFDSDKTAGNAAACVGPGAVTVTQTKVFSTSSGIIDLTAP
jgi:hypothetical protein